MEDDECGGDEGSGGTIRNAGPILSRAVIDVIVDCRAVLAHRPCVADAIESNCSPVFSIEASSLSCHTSFNSALSLRRASGPSKAGPKSTLLGLGDGLEICINLIDSISFPRFFVQKCRN
jgi:hypothetical protein